MSDVEALARVHDPVAFNDAAWRRTIGAQYTAERRRLESLAWAQAILADPGPLLEALPDGAIEAEALRRFYPARRMTGLSD